MAGIFGSNKAKDEQAAADRRLRRLIAKGEGRDAEEEEHPAAEIESGNRAEPLAEEETQYAEGEEPRSAGA